MFFIESTVTPSEFSVTGSILFRKTAKSIIKMQHLEGIYKLLPCITFNCVLLDISWGLFRFDAGHPCDRGPVLHIYKREGARSPAQGEPEEPPGTDQPAAAELHETALAR